MTGARWIAGVGADALVGAGVGGGALGLLAIHGALPGQGLLALTRPPWDPLVGVVGVATAVLLVGGLALDLLARLLAADRGVSLLVRAGTLAMLAGGGASWAAASAAPQGAFFAGMLFLLGLLAWVLALLLAALGWATCQFAALRRTLAIRARVRTLERQ